MPNAGGLECVLEAAGACRSSAPSVKYSGVTAIKLLDLEKCLQQVDVCSAPIACGRYYYRMTFTFANNSRFTASIGFVVSLSLETFDACTCRVVAEMMLETMEQLRRQQVRCPSMVVGS